MSNVMLRLIQLLENPLRFFHVEEFDDRSKKAEILAEMPEYEEFLKKNKEMTKIAAGIPAELKTCYRSALLTKEQEQHLFKKMNFLKYKANNILVKCQIKKPKKLYVDMAEKLLRQAALIKQRIVSSNVRLVVNIAKKQKDNEHFNTANTNMTERVSDGNLGLVIAVDYFDFRMGHRFSTYATWAIREKLNTARKRKLHYHMNTTNNHDEFLSEQTDYRCKEEMVEVNDRMKLVRQLLEKIDTRQRNIIIDYYANDEGLKEIAKKLGISKERVRQLKVEGIEKLKGMLNA